MLKYLTFLNFLILYQKEFQSKSEDLSHLTDLFTDEKDYMGLPENATTNIECKKGSPIQCQFKKCEPPCKEVITWV